MGGLYGPCRTGLCLLLRRNPFTVVAETYPNLPVLRVDDICLGSVMPESMGTTSGDIHTVDASGMACAKHDITLLKEGGREGALCQGSSNPLDC
mmetsp:Transcript_1684/g.3126  ORF Transcript_1684/g.3126 Transcript_1684/m.3126 type:complete len:94 (-) Transcript_1684:45-326(-)